MEETPDFSKAFETLQEMLSDEQGQSQIQNILSMFSAPSEDSPPEKSSDNAPNPVQSLLSTGGMDMEMLLKIQKVMQAMNTADNQKTVFLNSLKPFLRESRREKLDKAATILKMTDVLKAFKDTQEGGV